MVECSSFHRIHTLALCSSRHMTERAERTQLILDINNFRMFDEFKLMKKHTYSSYVSWAGGCEGGGGGILCAAGAGGRARVAAAPLGD